MDPCMTLRGPPGCQGTPYIPLDQNIEPSPLMFLFSLLCPSNVRKFSTVRRYLPLFHNEHFLECIRTSFCALLDNAIISFMHTDTCAMRCLRQHLHPPLAISCYNTVLSYSYYELMQSTFSNHVRGHICLLSSEKSTTSTTSRASSS